MNQSTDLFEASLISEDQIRANAATSSNQPAQESIARRGSRYIRRAGEALLGMPGDIMQLARQLPGALSDEQISEQAFPKNVIGAALGMLPGSEEMRAMSAESAPELEPQSEFEAIEDEFVGDAATLMLPVKGKIPFMKALGLSAFGNMTKQGIKAIGGGEGAQEAGKMGAMIFGGMFGKGRGVNKFIERNYAQAAEFVPAGDRLTYPMKKLDNVEKMLAKGAMNDAKSGAMDLLNELKSKAPEGRMLVDEAVQFDKDINRAIMKAGKDKSKAGYLKQLKKAHASALDDYAKDNPSWAKHYNEAKMAYAGIAESQDIQNYIRKHANLKNVVYAGAALGLGEMYLPGDRAMKLGALGATAAAIYSREIAKRLATNPALRRYYQNVLTASVNENSAMLARNLAGLDRVARKEFEKNPIDIEILSFSEDVAENEG